MKPKPWVQVACVCEKALIEPDNVPSLIRIVDTYTLDVPKGVPPGIELATNLTAMVLLKSGDVIGEFEVGMRLISPDGKASQVRKWPVVFNGGEYGVNIKLAFTLSSPQLGLYWFDVLWGDEVLTRIPFRLQAKLEEPTIDAGAPNEPGPQ